jgi:hypothetical protein
MPQLNDDVTRRKQAGPYDSDLLFFTGGLRPARDRPQKGWRYEAGASMFVMSLLMAGLLAISGMWESADAALVRLGFHDGARLGRKQGRILDRLLDQDGT